MQIRLNSETIVNTEMKHYKIAVAGTDYVGLILFMGFIKFYRRFTLGFTY